MNSERLSEAMRRMDVAAVLATTYEHVVYTAGFSSATGRMYPQIPHWCLVPRADIGPPVPIMPVAEAGLLADKGFDAARVVLFGRPSEHLAQAGALEGVDHTLQAMLTQAVPGIADALIRACAQAGLGSARIAVDSAQGNATLLMLQATVSGPAWKPHGDSALLWARMVKTAAERELIRAAGALNQAAIERALAVLGQGGCDADFGQVFREHVVAQGGEPTFLMAGSARRAGSFRPPDRRVPRTGERFRWDCGLRLHGYCADTGGTAQIRAEPSVEESRIYGAVTAGVQAALEQARPGMRASELYRLVGDVVRAAGLARFAHPHVGHGIGVEARDIPLLTQRQPDRVVFIDGEFDPVLEPGMVLNVETPLSVMGEGGYQHEITFWVGERSNELLTPLHPYYRVGN